MTTITSNGYQIGMVDVPSMSLGYDVNNYADDAEFMFMIDLGEVDPELDHDETLITKKLPGTGWQILGPGLSTQCSEEDAGRVVGDPETLIHEDQKWEYWPDHTDKHGQNIVYTPLASLHSLIRANGKEPGKVVVIYKPLK